MKLLENLLFICFNPFFLLKILLRFIGLQIWGKCLRENRDLFEVPDIQSVVRVKLYCLLSFYKVELITDYPMLSTYIEICPYQPKCTNNFVVNNKCNY